ncbi:hypothetical protein Tco_0222372 [Tanacetum coccineum]
MEDQALYKFKEDDFPNLNLRDIEDMLLLLVQKKISNLERDVIFDLNVALGNYNMHNIGNTVGELHALLIEYDKGLPKKASTPQVLMIQEGRIQKSTKQSQNAKRKGKGKGKGKDKLKKKQVDTASTSDYGISVSKNDVLYFIAIQRDGIYEIDMLNLVPNVNSIYNVSNKRAKHNLDFTYLWHCRLAHISKKHI